VVPGISDADFRAIAHAAKTHGPIAHALRADVTLTISRGEHLIVTEPATDPQLRPEHRW
jgi:hypothetical protein